MRLACRDRKPEHEYRKQNDDDKRPIHAKASRAAEIDRALPYQQTRSHGKSAGRKKNSSNAIVLKLNPNSAGNASGAGDLPRSTNLRAPAPLRRCKSGLVEIDVPALP